MTSTLAILLTIPLSAPPKEPWTTPKGPIEYGHGLTKEQALEGWLSLFDGKSTFGWNGAILRKGQLHGGRSRAFFGPIQIRAKIVKGGILRIGRIPLPVRPGILTTFVREKRAQINLGSVRISSLIVRPLGLEDQFNGKNLDSWKVIKHPRLPLSRQAKWSAEKGVIRAIGGPGALELQKKSFGDFCLQIDVRARANLVNGGVFFRSIPGKFMLGYEAQIFNACHGRDRSRVARYSTGAIDDRQLARRLVSSDREWFTMTVLAVGNQISTWVNGYQTVNWVDEREPDENPRKGLRVKPGSLQIQAHDPKTDLEVRRIRIVEIQK